jgi:hypothetical protein
MSLTAPQLEMFLFGRGGGGEMSTQWQLWHGGFNAMMRQEKNIKWQRVGRHFDTRFLVEPTSSWGFQLPPFDW